MRRDTEHQHPRLALGLIALGIAARLAPHPPNATPLMAIALFGGTHLGRRWAIALPLVIIVASDALIGWHATLPFTWGAVMLTGFVGWWVGRQPSAGRISRGALASALLFFVITNFGVWLVGDLYPRTLSGLWACYMAALPFLRNALIGDAIYTAALFGGFAMTARACPARQALGA